jgi:dTDP-4-amino-4,6-dideoxygalactose transaminase
MRPNAIPYVDVARGTAALRAELLRAIAGVLERGQFILGAEVEEFEERFAKLCQVKHAVALNSGTDALIFALRALGIGPGDEVITAPNSFVASASCIALVGAKPVFVDVRADYNIDPALIPQAITPRTRAIIPVHLTGRPADMHAICAIADKHGLAVIEDAAQAVTARYHDRPVGSLGTIGCFSLHPLKTLGACGDGGVLTTNDAATASKARLHRNLGLQSRENCVLWASNSRLDTLQAAILLVKLPHLEAWTEARRRNAQLYHARLVGIPQLRLPNEPSEQPHERAVYHTYVVRAESREPLMRWLAERGIGTAVHYPIPIHLQDVAADLGYGRGSFPVAEALASEILSLPIYPELSADDIGAVSNAIATFYEQHAR